MGVWDLTGHLCGLGFQSQCEGKPGRRFWNGICMILQGHSACCCEWAVRGKNGIRESREKFWQ